MQTIAQFSQAQDILTYSLLASIVVIVLIRTLISFVIVRILRNSLNSAIAATEKVSAGDLTKQIEVTSNDEVGKPLGAFQTMTQKLNSLIRQVQQSGIQITTSTTQIAASGKELEAAVTQQVASTNEVVATAQYIANNSE